MDPNVTAHKQGGDPIPQKAWQARSTLNFLKRNPNAIMNEEVVHLSNESVVHVLRKTFEVVSRDTHYISKASRIILRDHVSGKLYQEDEVWRAEQVLIAVRAGINEFFDKRLKQAEQKFIDGGKDPDNVKRPTVPYQAFCPTPDATDYLSILTKADIYLVLLDSLHTAQLLSHTPEEAIRVKLNSEREARNQLLLLPRKTTSQFNIIRHICSGVMEQRLVARKAQSERAKAQNREAKELQARTLGGMQEDMTQLAQAA